MRFPNMHSPDLWDRRWVSAVAVLIALAAPAFAAGLEQAEIVGLATKCLDVRGGSTAEGADVILFRCHGGENQRWDLPVRGFTGEIVGVGGMCLDIRGRVRDRARAEMRTCDGSPSQQWRFGQDGRIVGADGLCLDVLESNTSDGARVVVFECHGKANQRWRPRVENRFTLVDLEAGAGIARVWPDPNRPGVLFANEHSTGIYRSEDGGESWSPLWDAPGLGWADFVAVSPADSDVVYARREIVTSLGPRGPVEYDRTYFRSFDGGRSWSETEPLTRLILDFAPDDRRARRVFALDASGRVFRSSSAGGRWAQLGKLPIADGPATHGLLRVVPGSPDVLFASAYFDNSRHFEEHGFFKSSDGGRHWRRLLGDASVFDLQLDPVDPRWIYARTGEGWLRSSDAGSSWVALVFPDPPAYVEVLFVDPSDPRRLVAGSNAAVWRSDDRGDSWSSLLLPPGSTFFLLAGFSAQGESLFGSGETSGREGLWVSHDLGTSWRQSVRGFTSPWILGVGMSGALSERAYAYAFTGLFGSADGGTSWRRLASGLYRGVAVDPSDARHILAMPDTPGLSSSADGGRTFQPSSEGFGGRFVETVAFDPRDAGIAYAVTSGCGDSGSCVFRSTDGGSSWSRVFETAAGSRGLEVDAGGERLYLATHSGLLISEDGDSWRIDVELSTMVAADRTVPGRVWSYSQTVLLLSEDGGDIWREIDQPPAETSSGEARLRMAAAAGGAVYARFFNSPWVWRSIDEGETWAALDVGQRRGYNENLEADPRHPGRVWLSLWDVGLFVGDFSD